MRFAVSALCAAVAALYASSLRAQIAEPERDQRVAQLIARADSLTESGDSTGALTLLDSVLRLDRRAAGAWHRKGHIAWRLAQPDSTAKVDWNQRTISLMRMADTSLRYATVFAPDSGAYHLTLANYFLANRTVTVRFNAIESFQRAAETALRSGDSIIASEALDRTGMRYWRRYEPLIDRVAPGGIDVPDFELYMQHDKELANFLENHVPRARSQLGDADYGRALSHFRQALAVHPHNAMARRHLFMALTARSQWEALREAARTRLDAAPWDAWGWLALGLASHRLDESRAAAAAFDSATVLLSPAERRHFTRLSRLLGPKDTTRFAGMSDEQRLRSERLYWVVADPLALTPGNEYWLEFLSRITQAELMFSVEEFGIRGADTDRGEVLIRYGPPDLSVSFPPDAYGRIGIIWRYRNGLAFSFRLMPNFGTAEAMFESRDMHEERIALTPVRWDNVPVTRRMDSITTLVTRFRSGDSTDVLVAAEIPTGRIARGVDLTSGTLRYGILAFGAAANLLARDTASMEIALRPSDSTRVLRRSWRYRLGITPEVGYRVEALQPESGNAARAVGVLELPNAAGFGLSDVLLADSVRSAAGLPQRWSDLAVAPSVGRIRRGRDLAMVWETYDLGADSTRSSAYRVDIGLVRTDGSRIGRAVARVIGGTLGRGEGRGRDDRVTVSFDRRVPARPVMLDYLTLDLGDLAPGRYRLTISVTDLVTNATTSSERELTIVR
jgi:GWxTD domain-containing protein